MVDHPIVSASSRRMVIAGSVAAATLTACGSDDGDASSGSSTAATSDTSTSETASDTGSESASDTATESDGTTLAAADVPVGGGTILTDAAVVVTQPAEGDFKAFSAVCTHQNCMVSSVADNQINCACHGSAYSAEDGSVINGPATNPLPAVDITVDGETLTIA